MAYWVTVRVSWVVRVRPEAVPVAVMGMVYVPGAVAGTRVR